MSELAPARLFVLRRIEDIGGISGTGDVAQGVVFGDGTAVLRWTSQWRSTAVYASLADLEAIHGHDGRTSVVFLADVSKAIADAVELMAATMGNRPVWDNREHIGRFVVDAAMEAILHPAAERSWCVVHDRWEIGDAANAIHEPVA